MDPLYLFAMLIWGTIGMGYFLYGKKRNRLVPLFGGVALMGITYFIKSPLNMSLVSVALMGGIYYLNKRI
jgi:hypothetical protein